MSPAGISTVARQEFRLRIRAGRWKALLGVWFAVVVLFTYGLSHSVSSLAGADGRRVTDGGVVVYGGLALFVLGLALLVVPALAAQSVNGDRERGTLATLQVTRLTAGDIALGKFAAAWGTALAFLALTLPSVVYASSLGGVSLARVLACTLVLALLLGTVCAVSLALSALLARTTTSGVLSYLAVFGLTVGTLIVFGLVTATTTEHYTERGQSCDENGCHDDGSTYESSRSRTDRTWWLLAPNPFVVLADSAPVLPPLTAAQQKEREARQERGEDVRDARDLDPLGGIGRTVRDLRTPPSANVGDVAQPGLQVYSDGAPPTTRRLWPTGLAADLVLAAGALFVTTRRLRTPTRTLPKGARVA